MIRAAIYLATGLTLASLSTGCAVLGPRAVEKCHGPYAAAVLEVDEEQLLGNIVRLRYVESPRSLDVSAIAAQYELDASAEARPFFSTEATGNLFRSFTTILPFVGLSGANRPTISLAPSDESSAIRQFLTPITTDTLVFLSQSGWPVSSILRIWVDRLNGVPNWVPSGPPRDIPADFERFRRACELLQAAQDQELLSVHTEERYVEISDPLPKDAVTAAAAVEAAKNGYEYRQRGEGNAWALVKRERKLVLVVNPAGQGNPIVVELLENLNLVPGLDRYELVAGAGVPDPAKNPTPPATVLRLGLRSSAQALFFLANGVAVPPEHITCGLVRPPDGDETMAATEGIFRVHCCKGHKHCPPGQAYTAIWYRGYWFYIDDRDQESKSTLLLMLQLRRLDFKRQQIGSIPALTLPVGR